LHRLISWRFIYHGVSADNQCTSDQTFRFTA
jgi:hypothetical protein